MKKHNLTPLQLLASGGVCIPLIFGAIFLAPRCGLNLNAVSEWVIGGSMIVVTFATYIGVHYLPTRMGVKFGIIGWLVIPVTLVVLTSR